VLLARDAAGYSTSRGVRVTRTRASTTLTLTPASRTLLVDEAATLDDAAGAGVGPGPGPEPGGGGDLHAAGSPELVEAVRQKADTYIYTNPLGAADCAAAVAAVDIADSTEGRERLANLGARTQQFRRGLDAMGLESIPGPHPVVPLLVRSTDKVRAMVRGLFARQILAVGLTFPVVPKGDETIRFQINAAHTEADIDEVLKAVGDVRIL
jgi:Aminotransferase class I and II